MAHRKVQPVDPKVLPAGHTRNEALRAQADALEEQAEKRAESLGAERIDPKKLRIEPEIVQQFDPITNQLNVINPDPCYVYTWVCSRSSSTQVDRKLNEGWEVVQGEDPAAQDKMGTRGDTTRHVGDTILMKIRKDRYYILEKRQAYKRVLQQEGVNAQLKDMANSVERRYGHHVSIHTDVDSPLIKEAFAKHLAGSQFEKAVRSGTVPGLPAPGVGR